MHKMSQQQPHIIPWPTQQIHQLSQICQLSKADSLATLGLSLTTQLLSLTAQQLSTAFQSPISQLTRTLQSNTTCLPLLPLLSLQSQQLLCLSQGFRHGS